MSETRIPLESEASGVADQERAELQIELHNLTAKQNSGETLSENESGRITELKRNLLSRWGISQADIRNLDDAHGS